MQGAPHQIVLNGTTYSVTNWDVDKALLTLVWLTKTFGEGFVGLLTSKAGSEFLFGAEDDDQAEDVGEEDGLIPQPSGGSQVMQEFMAKVIDRLDERTYVKYAKHILDGVRIGTTKVNFGIHFIGKMALLHQLIFEVLRFQYGDFLDDTPGKDL